MSDENNQDGGRLGGGAVLVAILSIILFGSWQLARAMAADYDSIVAATTYSLPLAGLALLLWWYFNPSWVSILALFLAAAWPCWWPVLDSLAATYADPSSGFLRLSMQLNNAWYGKAWARWLVELAAICLLYLGFRRQRD